MTTNVVGGPCVAGNYCGMSLDEAQGVSPDPPPSQCSASFDVPRTIPGTAGGVDEYPLVLQ